MNFVATTEGRIGGVAPARIAELRAREAETFRKARPKSEAAVGRGAKGFFGGVPMHWMKDWPTPFPILVERAKGATITDVDGNTLADFCLGDTGSMFGHSPAPVTRAIRRQASRGLAYMLPSDDALAVGLLLQERFGLPFWQIATTATDCNRFALRVARAVTGRPKILVFNGSYHGSVDETMVRLKDGEPVNRPGLAGEFRDLTQATKIVEFNDLAAIEVALGSRDVACVITEPVLTNCCMVEPDPGFHDGLRRITRDTGTLLLIEIHLRAGTAEERRRGGKRPCTGAGSRHSRRPRQSRHADRPVPQHDAHLAGNHGPAGGPAAFRLRRYCRQAHGVRQARRLLSSSKGSL